MSSLLGCALSARLAAIAPVAGLRFPAGCSGRPLPVLTFHGLADRQNTYDGRARPGEGWEESVPEALAGWARRNRCTGRAHRRRPARSALDAALHRLCRQRRGAPDSHRRPRSSLDAGRGGHDGGAMAGLQGPSSSVSGVAALAPGEIRVGIDRLALPPLLVRAQRKMVKCRCGASGGRVAGAAHVADHLAALERIALARGPGA